MRTSEAPPDDVLELTADAGQVVGQVVADSLEVPEVLRVSDWADRYGALPSKDAKGHRYDSGITPYVRGPMEALSYDHPAREVSLMWGSQLSKTTTGLLWMASAVHQNPCLFMMVQPTLEVARKYARTKVDPLIDNVDVIRGSFSRNARDAANTSNLKEFPGGALILSGANSAASLKMLSVQYLHLDEVDSYPVDVDDEGDPCELAEVRTRSFMGYKVLKTATPTLRHTSRIEAAYLESDRSRYHVPCPHCGFRQALKWAGIIYEADENPITVHSVGYKCDRCQDLIEEKFKAWMLDEGEWVAERPELSRRHRGFHLSSLYSPFASFGWRQIVEKWIKAQRATTHGPRMVFTNTVLAETYEDQATTPPDAEKLWLGRESWEEWTIPKGAGPVLTMGVDVQADRIELEVVAWGRNLESWSIAYQVIPGSIDSREAQRAFELVLHRQFPVASSPSKLSIRLACVDAGYATSEVYKACRRWHPRAIPIVGREGGIGLVGTPQRADITRKGKKSRSGIRSWPVYGDVAKPELYAWLKSARPPSDDQTFPPGFCHFPQNRPQGYFKGLTIESVAPRYRRGVATYVWTCPSGGRNEPLDCRVYARAAAAILGVDRYTPEDWSKLEAQVETGGPVRDSSKTRKPPGRRGGYFDRHR